MRTHGIGAGRRGIATIEFALVAPLLLLMLAGVLDYAMLLRTATALADAARCGAQYGSANSSDTARMQSIAADAAPGIAMQVNAGCTCQLPGGSPVQCSGSCTGGKIYVKVTTSATVPTVFQYSGLSFSHAVSYTATMRAQ